MKRIFSLMLVICMLSFASVSAFAQDSGESAGFENTELFAVEDLKEFIDSIPQSYLAKNPELTNTLKELNEILKSGETDVKEIEYLLSLTDAYRALAEKNNDLSVIVNSFERTYASDFDRIDALAQEYYNEYLRTGVLPDTNSQGSKMALSSASGVAALGSLGIAETESRLAARLVTLGVTAQLDGPLPVLDLICLVAGVVILTDYVVDGLRNNKTAVSNNIKTFYGASYGTISSTAIGVSAAVLSQARQGWNHFEAFRINPTGIGGIAIGNPLPYSAAANWLRTNDVWSVNQNAAYLIAKQISFGSEPDHDNAHTGQNGAQILNKPHYHPTLLFVRFGGHSFHN